MIPTSISEISHEWIENLAKILDPKLVDTSLKISSLSINTSNCSEELFECCNLSVTLEDLDVKYQWQIKLVPSDPDLREIVLRHDLFKKELLIHQVVIPALQTFVYSKLGMSLTICWHFAQKNDQIGNTYSRQIRRLPNT